MKIKPQFILLLAIFLIAFIFRFISIWSIPPHPTLDEVSIGYNAYSILKTGADEYGNKLPILLRAYDDWRPALYVYLVIPFTAVLGLDILSVRLPSIILSILTVVAVYLLSRYLFRNSYSVKLGKIYLDIPIAVTIFLAISPWHIYISRLGHEVNAHFSFLIFGICFFYRFLDKKKWSIYLSSVFFALSFASYQNGKIIIPLIVMVLFVIYFKKIISEKKELIISLILGFIIIIPTLLTLLDSNSLIRYEGTSLVQNSPDYFNEVSKRFMLDKQSDNYSGIFFDNKKTASILLISNAYFSHFNPSWLFFNNGKDFFKAPNIGLLSLVELPLIFLGVVSIVRIGISRSVLLFLFFWTLISVIPASITTGFPHAMRVFGLLPIPHILSGIGLLFIFNIFNKKYKYYIFAVFCLSVFISSLWFYNSYFKLLPREISNQFQYGVLEGMSEIRKNQDNFENVFISNKETLNQSYMYYLFLNKFDPKTYQELGGTISAGYDKDHKINKYYFGDTSNFEFNPKSIYLLNITEYDSLKSNSELGKVLFTKSIITNKLGEPILIIAYTK